ncbi:MAG: MFS transporter, partial [Acidobacteria bacterium]|nr:MFS transporter [Acidobacteriota bacterium]
MNQDTGYYPLNDTKQLNNLSDTDEPEVSGARWRALALLSIAELLGMSLWFSASAIVPRLQAEWHLSQASAGWLTLAVQIGFVVGTLLSAILNLPDVMSARRLFTVSAILGAACNASFALLAHDPATGIALRFMTGLFLAGVYPPGMKIMATWFRRGRGLALGVMVGALALGKASPYLVNAMGSADWRRNVLFMSVLAVAGGLLVQLFVRDGPYSLGRAPFDIKQVARVFSNRGVRLANFGYFGHMWELYAMWTWLPVMIRASLEQSGSAPVLAEAASFLVIGAGALGCVAGGFAGDQMGRTLTTSWAMGISGAC